MLIKPPSVLQEDTDSTVSSEHEDKLLGEEVEMVLRIKEDTGIRTAKLFINNIRRIFSVPE
jgi:hypothetical protein